MNTPLPDGPQWVPDPLGRHELRFWNGENWTEHVSDRGVTASDPLRSPNIVTTEPEHIRAKWLRFSLLIGAVVVAGIGIAVFSASSETGDDRSGTLPTIADNPSTSAAVLDPAIVGRWAGQCTDVLAVVEFRPTRPLLLKLPPTSLKVTTWLRLAVRFHLGTLMATPKATTA